MNVAIATLRGPSRAARWRRRRTRRLAAIGLLALGALTVTPHGAPAASPTTVTTATRLGTPRAVIPRGQSQVVVPVDDPHIAALVQPGDHVDLYDGASTTPVAGNLEVVRSLAAAPSVGTGASPALLVVAANQRVGGITRAIGLAAASGGTLRVAIGSRP